MNPPFEPEPWLIAGPTGVGKSAFAVALARQVGGEIVCADAFQIYQGLPVLTAQPTAEEQAAIPHHLFGHLPPTESCDVLRWLDAAESVVRAIQARGRRAILVGGTGLYFRAFTHGLDPLPPVNPELRTQLSQWTLGQQIDRLRELDPDCLEVLDLQNPRRVQRALEIVWTSGRPLASHRRSWAAPARRPFAGVVLSRERSILRARIIRNVDALLAGGAVEEVRCFLEKSKDLSVPLTVTQAIGFSPIAEMLRGGMDFAACRARIIQQTHAYAKRQETWFRRETSCQNWQRLEAGADGEFPRINLAVKADTAKKPG